MITAVISRIFLILNILICIIRFLILPPESKYLKAPSPSLKKKRREKIKKRRHLHLFMYWPWPPLPCNYFTQQIKKRSVVNQQLLETKDKDEFAANEDSCQQALP